MKYRPDPRVAPDQWIVTESGRLLAYDGERRALTSASDFHHPGLVRARTHGGEARLACEIGGRLSGLSLRDAGIVPCSPDRASRWKIEEGGQARGGPVRLEPSPWPRRRARNGGGSHQLATPVWLISSGTVSLLRAAARDRWVRAADKKMIERGALELLPGFRFRFGSQEGALGDLCASAAGDGEARPDRLRLLFDWVVEDFHRVRPLAYFTAFAAKGYFEMLRMSLDTLLRFSGSDMDFLVIHGNGDEGRLADALGGLPDHARARLAFMAVDAPDIAAICFSRWRIAEHAPARHHRPILYLDCDVLCDADLQPLIAAAATASKVLAASEHTVLHPKDWFGRSLFERDPTLPLQDAPAFNAGVMAAPGLEVLAPAFQAARRVAEAWFRTSGVYPRTFDQGAANYAFRKLDLVDPQGLDSFVRVHGNRADADPTARRGLIHFCGGVGEAEPKLPRMRAYYAAIMDAEAPLKEALSAR